MNLSVSSARLSDVADPADAAASARVSDIRGGSPAVLTWERDSLDADALAYFQTAAWSRVAAEYDSAIGRAPLLLSWRQPGGAGFSLPLSIGREKGCKVARVLGEQLVEYSDVIGPRVVPESLREGFALLRRRHGVDLVALRRVPAGTPLDMALDAIGALRESPQMAPWIPLGPQGPLPNENGGLPAGYRDGRRRRNRLREEVPCAFEVHPAGAAAHELMRLALGWKKDWVKERRLVSRVGTDSLDAAICSLMRTPGLGSVVGVLRVDAEPAAVASGFVFRDRFYCFIRAYRPDRAAQSVGRVAVTEMIEWCGATGLEVYDYGPPADGFKCEWTDRLMPVANRLVPLSWFGRVQGQLIEAGLKPVARAALDSLPASVRAGLLRLTRYTH